VSSAVTPLVSVIVPTLNRPFELGEALASVTGQQGVDLGELEVIVVNDGRHTDRLCGSRSQRPWAAGDRATPLQLLACTRWNCTRTVSDPGDDERLSA
jgi:cellulose synthase/poly-beta-1,6-N-acetylglucosamine synthase-like glycosyltransferase